MILFLRQWKIIVTPIPVTLEASVSLVISPSPASVQLATLDVFVLNVSSKPFLYFPCSQSTWPFQTSYFFLTPRYSTLSNLQLLSSPPNHIFTHSVPTSHLSPIYLFFIEPYFYSPISFPQPHLSPIYPFHLHHNSFFPYSTLFFQPTYRFPTSIHSTLTAPSSPPSLPFFRRPIHFLPNHFFHLLIPLSYPSSQLIYPTYPSNLPIFPQPIHTILL